LGVTTDLKWSDFPCEEVIHKGVSAPMPAECRRRLEEIYRQDIEDLYEEFGEPVDSWRVS